MNLSETPDHAPLWASADAAERSLAGRFPDSQQVTILNAQLALRDGRFKEAIALLDPSDKNEMLEKVNAAEAATKIALDAIQILGGNGYINDYPTGRLLRDAKLYEIGAGTSEIRRMLIGRELFEKTG